MTTNILDYFTLQNILGFFTPWIGYAVITLLHCIFPARKIKGYVRHDKTGDLLHYRINGIFVLIASVLIWWGLGKHNWVPWDWMYTVRWASLAGAVTLGLLYSLIVVFIRPSTGKNFIADFWFGRIKNPQFKNGFIDAKMWLYLIGAVWLEINILSFAAHHWQSPDGFNLGYLAATGLLSFFLWEYLSFEKVHLYTYDLIAERVGFKLGFGCLAFYPYFYSVGLWATVDLPNPDRPLWYTIACACIYFTGWAIARGANMQKYFFKISPEKKFLGIKPLILSDGKHSLLANGFWGKSRHINYLGEILEAVGIVLATGYFSVWLIWLYPAYYVFLFITRQIDDNKICKAKYGDLWDEYVKKAKYRIIPYIY
ncbi:MAG: ERG4/ERG24 family protein [Treponema sp.]|nr:ERG4/ERG24 family protein [Treponema sp.]